MHSKTGDRLEGVLQDRAGPDVEPPVEQRGVDAAEVGRVLQVTVVEVCQRRVPAVDAALYFAADDEHRAGGAVVGAGGAVLAHATAELAEAHHRDLLAVAL